MSNILSLPFVIPENNILSFYFMYIMAINDVRGRANFDPRALISSNLVVIHYTMFHAKYLTSNFCHFKTQKNRSVGRGSNKTYHIPNFKVLGLVLENKTILLICIF
jgi:hypothetical protein